MTDLDRMAHELADAITILGIDVVPGMLFRGRPKGTFKEPFKPRSSFQLIGSSPR